MDFKDGRFIDDEEFDVYVPEAKTSVKALKSDSPYAIRQKAYMKVNGGHKPNTSFGVNPFASKADVALALHYEEPSPDVLGYAKDIALAPIKGTAQFGASALSTLEQGFAGIDVLSSEAIRYADLGISSFLAQFSDEAQERVIQLTDPKFEEALREVQSERMKQSETYSKKMSDAIGLPEGLPRDIISGAGSVGTSLLLSTTGGPLATAGFYGLSSAGSQFVELNEAGEGLALPRSLMGGTISGWANTIGDKAIINSIVGRTAEKIGLKSLGKAVLKGGSGEFIEEGVEALAENINLQDARELTWQDVAVDSLYQAVVGGIVGAFLGGAGNVAYTKFAPLTENIVEERLVEAGLSEAEAKIMAHDISTATTSEKMKQTLLEVLSDDANPIKYRDGSMEADIDYTIKQIPSQLESVLVQSEIDILPRPTIQNPDVEPISLPETITLSGIEFDTKETPKLAGLLFQMAQEGEKVETLADAINAVSKRLDIEGNQKMAYELDKAKQNIYSKLQERFGKEYADTASEVAKANIYAGARMLGISPSEYLQKFFADVKTTEYKDFLQRTGRYEEQAKIKRIENNVLDVFQAIKKLGGIKPTDQNVGDVRTLLDKGTFALLNEKTGVSLDDIRQGLIDLGFLFEQEGESTTTIQDVLDLIERQARGEKVYPLNYVEETQSQEDFDESVFRAEAILDENVVDYSQMSDKQKIDVATEVMNLNDFLGKYNFSEENMPITLEEKRQAVAELQASEDYIPFQDDEVNFDALFPEYTGETVNINGVERPVYNSEGNRIAKSKEALINFYKWFGDSKVVDEQGRPKVMKHWTPFDFSVFRIPNHDIGFHVGTEEQAKIIEKNDTREGKILDLYVKAKASLELNDVGYWTATTSFLNELVEKNVLGQDDAILILTSDEPLREKNKKISSLIKEKGYDSIKYINEHEYDGDYSYLLLDENQVKGTENDGYFSEKNNDFLLQEDQNKIYSVFDLKVGDSLKAFGVVEEINMNDKQIKIGGEWHSMFMLDVEANRTGLTLGAKEDVDISEGIDEDVKKVSEDRSSVEEQKTKNSEYNRIAENYFGITNNLNLGGYILTNGNLLDLSGKNLGSAGKTRAVDHREISDAFENYNVSMEDFINSGNIRYMPESNSILMSDIPNQKQYKIIESILERANGQVNVELMSDANNWGSFRDYAREYPAGTDLSTIRRDINAFYKGQGIRPEMNFYQQEGKTPRGAFDPVSNTIYLFEKANRSTFMHEMAHNFLNVVYEGSMRGIGSAVEMKKDIDEWLGHKGGAYIEAEHERFARGFEQFLLEGKAPNNKLKKAFSAFKRWLINIYKSVRGIGLDLSDDIRQVYSEMLGGRDYDKIFESNQTLKTLEENIGAIEEKARQIAEARTNYAKQVAEDLVNSKEAQSKVRNAFSNYIKQKKESAGLVHEALVAGFTPLSTRAKEISPVLMLRMRDMMRRQGQFINKKMDKISPLLDGVNKMSDADKIRFDSYMKNGVQSGIEELCKKHGLTEQYQSYREAMDEIYDEASSVGIKINYREVYAPRKIKDKQAFLEFIRNSNAGLISQMDAEIGAGASIDEQAEWLDNHLFTWNLSDPMTATPANAKERTIDVIDKEIDGFYYSTTEAIASYVDGMAQAIVMREVFGATRDADGTNEGLNKSIGEIIAHLREEGKITTNKQAEEVRKIMNSLLMNHGVQSKILSRIKSGSMATLLTRFTQTLSQLADIGTSIKQSGFSSTLRGFLGNDITMEDIGLEKLTEEYRKKDGLHKQLDFLFKISGFNAMDKFGKSTYLNGRWDYFQKMAKNNPEKLKDYLEPMFEDRTNALFNDIKNGRVSEDVKLLMFSEISDIQPTTLAEMPSGYVNNPNGRILYMLKTFTLRRLDFVLNQTYRMAKSGKKAQAFKNLASIALWMGGFEALVALLKDFLRGRELSITDNMLDAMMGIFMINRYQMYKAREEGWSGFASTLIPPMFPMADAIGSDATKIIKGKIAPKDLKVWSYMPLIGDAYYWWFGGGLEKNKKKKKSLK